MATNLLFNQEPWVLKDLYTFTRAMSEHKPVQIQHFPQNMDFKSTATLSCWDLVSA